MEPALGPESESRPAKVPKSWLDLKWNNPENSSRLGRTPRRVKSCQRCSRPCKRNADCFLCKRLGQVSKFPKLSVKTVEKGSAKTSEVETADSEESRRYRQHWWRCNGPCRDKMPYLGVIRKFTSRRPGPTDKWWSEHVKTCGGTFVKVRNPEVPEPKNLDSSKNGDIRNFLSGVICSGTSDSSAVSSDLSGSTTEETNPLFQPEDEEFKNSLLVICDDIEVKLTSDSTTVESDSCNKDSAVQIDTSFQSEDDEGLTNSLLEVCDVVEARLQSEEDELASCLACGVQIFKKQLDLHLITCMKDIFEVDLDEVGDDGANNGGTSEFTCPFCLKSVSESDMKEHVDVCSSTEASASLFIDE